MGFGIRLASLSFRDASVSVLAYFVGMSIGLYSLNNYFRFLVGGFLVLQTSDYRSSTTRLSGRFQQTHLRKCFFNLLLQLRGAFA